MGGSQREKKVVDFLNFWERENRRFQAILFDIDGTLLYGPRQLPGAAELVGRVREAGTPLYFLTNDGNHTVEQKCAFLQRAGLAARPSEIISCIDALDTVAARNDWIGRTFFAVGELGHVNVLNLERDPRNLEHTAGILFGEGEYDWRTGWEAVINFLHRHPDRPLVVPNPDAYWPSPKSGTFGIGAGGQARCIQLLLHEMGTDLEPIYLGKPFRPIYDCVFTRLEKQFGLQVEPERILMLGDSLTSDVRGANRVGMVSALVLTGITTPEQAAAATGELKPRYVFRAIEWRS